MRRVSRLGSFRVIVIAALLTAALATAQAGGPRLVIEVEESFLLQGQVCPAGTVSIRLLSRYNPASTLHEIRVGGESLGVFQAEHVVRESRDGGDTSTSSGTARASGSWWVTRCVAATAPSSSGSRRRRTCRRS